MRTQFKHAMLGVSALVCAAGAQAAALDLSSNWYYTYGNTNSYSLPILAFQYDIAHGGGVGPGNPYYVNSTPGAIKDLVVIYTGAGGVGVTTNVAGIEDAFQTPSGSQPTFATTLGAGVSAPTGTAGKGIATTYATTWDASLTALKTFLDGGNPLFLFNNNDTRQDENLAIWAKVWITTGATDPGTGMDAVYQNRYLYLSNAAQPYGLGGVPYPAGNATTYNPGDVQPAFHGVDPATGLPLTDYVLSGGDVCVSNATGLVAPACGAGTTVIKHNLGANQAAFAGDIPLLDSWLSDLFANASGLGNYSLHVQLNLGCDPQYLSGNACDSFKIDNGYEQLFLTSNKPNRVPEPSSVALFGLALAGLALAGRRKAGGGYDICAATSRQRSNEASVGAQPCRLASLQASHIAVKASSSGR